MEEIYQLEIVYFSRTRNLCNVVELPMGCPNEEAFFVNQLINAYLFHTEYIS